MPCPPGDQCLDPEWCQQSRDCLRDNDDQIDQLMRAFAYEQGRQDRAWHLPCPYRHPVLAERWRDGWEAMDRALVLLQQMARP